MILPFCCLSLSPVKNVVLFVPAEVELSLSLILLEDLVLLALEFGLLVTRMEDSESNSSELPPAAFCLCSARTE